MLKKIKDLIKLLIIKIKARILARRDSKIPLHIRYDKLKP